MKIKSLFILTFITCVLLYLQFGTILNAPNTTSIGTSLDGYKNYWTPSWHVLHDSTYHRFSGINYPYQEHVAFTDNQPLLSNIVRWWSRNVQNIAPNMIGIINVSMILSILIAAIFIFLLLKKLDLPNWYSIISAIAIAFLSPQIVRMSGHYALAYCCMIPILMYLVVRWHERQNAWRSLAIATYMILIAQIHLYYFGISVFFLLFFFMIKGIQDWRAKNLYKSFTFNGLHFLLQVILPYIFINFYWLKIDNNVVDRPSAPSGFLQYKAFLEGIFTSPDAFYYDFVNKNIATFPIVKDPEGVVYIGFVASIFTLSALLRFLTFRPYIFNENWLTEHASIWKSMFWVAFGLLLLSIGFPFCIKPFEPLLEFTGPLKQFRGIGRFAWVYFYVANIAALYFAYDWSETWRVQNRKYAFRLLVLGILCFEAFTFQQKHAQFATQTEADIWRATGETIDKILPYFDKNKYQAAFPIPYYNVGSENFHIDPIEKTFQYCSFPALKTGLPTMGNFLSRTSLTQAYKGLQMALSPYRSLDIIQDLNPTKPILLVVNKQADTSHYYHFMTSKSTFLYENKAIKLYSLSIDSLKNLHQKVSHKTLPDTTQCLHYQSFDNQKSEKTYRGNGAFEQTITAQTIVFDAHINGQQKGHKYKVGFWTYSGADLYPTLEIFIRELDSKTNAQLQFIHWGLRYKLIALDNQWAYYEVPFDAWFSDSHFEINVTQSRLYGKPLLLDDLMIKYR